MKRSRIFFFSCLIAFAMITLAASCSDEQGARPRKSGTGRYYQPKDSGAAASDVVVPEFDAGEFDAMMAEFEMPKEISTTGQAVQVLLTAYDLEVKEAEFGKANASGPPMMAYANDLIKDVKASRARLKGIIAAKGISPRRTNMIDRMKFESQASMGQLTGIFKNMFSSVWVNRRIDSANNLTRVLNEQLVPVLREDDDFEVEIETIRQELDKRVERAERVRAGLSGGVGVDNGMFEEIDDPIPPRQMPKPGQVQQPQFPQQMPALPQQQPQTPAEEPAATQDAGPAP